MQYNKPGTSIDDQAALLLQRGLVCPDVEHLKRCLYAIGYYRLGAYWLPFEQSAPAGQTRSKNFLPGVRIDDVMAIYIFDRHLRMIIMEAIERIEIAIRSRWTNRITLAHGSHAHLDPQLFSDPWAHAASVAKLARDVGQSHEVFIKHYKDKYTAPFMPPLWAVTETMTLGDLSKWYAATKDLKVKDGVAKDLGLPSREVLESALQVFSLVRNISAHHGRLWNRRMVKRLPAVRRWAADIVLEPPGAAGGGQNQPQNLVYNVLVALLHMLHHQNMDSTFPARLKGLVEGVTNSQRVAMGFPADWRARPAWNLP